MRKKIDYKHLIEDVCGFECDDDNYDQVFPTITAQQALNELPVADVQPVKHGEWKINSDGYYPYCSECGKEPESGKMTKFCPNCGARMDGGADDENSI